jgi:hypothetical protein
MTQAKTLLSKVLLFLNENRCLQDSPDLLETSKRHQKELEELCLSIGLGHLDVKTYLYPFIQISNGNLSLMLSQSMTGLYRLHLCDDDNLKTGDWELFQCSSYNSDMIYLTSPFLEMLINNKRG